MASAPPDTANTASDQRRHQAEAAALLLLTGRRMRRYDLPAMIAQAGVKPRPFRQIRPTEALKADLAAPHRAIAMAWDAQAPAIVDAHSRDPEAAHRQLAIATLAIGGFLSQVKRRFPAATARIELWHRIQWVSRIKAATGLDVALMTVASEVSAPIAATIAWNEALADDVSQQVRHRIATALAGGKSADDVARAIRDAVARAKRRAAGIGDDQVDKLSRAMDRARREAAGITSYIWHHTPQRHPRDWHRARDGMRFTPKTEPPAGDRAGEPPFCKCWTSPVI